MINMGELFAHDRISNIEMERVQLNEAELSSMLVEPGDLLFARQSLVLSGAGKCSIVVDASEPTTFESHLIRVRLKRDIAYPPFYHYYFKSPSAGVKAIVTQGVQAGIRGSDLKALPVRVPPISEQERIAEFLSAYDDLIENNRRRIALLEEAARMLYREWFVHFRFPGHEHVKIIDGLPEGWERRTLIDLAEVVMGQSPESKFYNEAGDGLPFHQGVTDYGFRYVTHRTYSTAITRLGQAGDILLSVRAPVGRINLTRDNIVLGRGLSAIRSRAGHQSFLFYALKNHFYAEDIIGTGAIYAATNKKELEGQLLVLPPNALLREFEDQGSQIDRQIENLTAQVDKLAQARDLLLPRLMNGEIAV
jgi:type I restriction enzyme S subunit